MKKIIYSIAFLMLWASPLLAQQAVEEKAVETKLEVPPEFRVGAGWYGVDQNGNTKAGEYDHLKSSPAGGFDMEWDPLPQRFLLESYFLNNKDYFGAVDYAFGDVVLINGLTRGLFHNLDHYSFGPDDPLTLSPSFTDLNPLDLYGVENQLRKGAIRFKTPDFPLHLYVEAITLDKEGLVQQRFLTLGGLNKVSESRPIDWNTSEYRVGLNSHLGPVEADYSHTEMKLKVLDQKFLTDADAGGPHNLVPDLKSSTDTFKAHTSYSGRFVLSGTYSNGDRQNEDSSAKAKFTNTAGDLMFMPVTSVILTVKYRHYDTDVTNPAVFNTATGITPIDVRQSISSRRDTVSGVVRYRATDRLTLRGEYVGDKTDRDNTNIGGSTNPAFWDLPQSTTKNTAKINVSYRIMNMLSFRADISETKVDNPAYATDPDKAHTARAVFTWMPTPKFNTMLSYSLVRETRDNLSAPLGGGTRDAKRDQGLASATVMLGNRSSLTASYGLYKNDVNQTITLTDGTSGALTTEPGVPYNDVSQMGSLTLTVAPSEGLNLIGSASRSYSRGNFVIAGANGVTNVSGISELSDMKVVDSLYSIGAEMQLTRLASCEIRYQYRHYDDKVDNTQDGTVKLTLATLSMKW